MTRLRVLIVDDMALSRKRLRRHLSAEPDVEIAGECSDGQTAVEVIRQVRPDVVLLDVQMPGMDGFEVVDAVGPAEMPFVIFVTAFDEFALRAFEVHALDYLLKPFSAQRLKKALDRARAATRQTAAGDVDKRLAALLEDARRRLKYASRMAVRSGGRTVYLNIDDIVYIEATGNYARLHTSDESHLIREKMNDLAATLDPERFVRVHRSTIINIDRVVEVESTVSGDQRVLLRGGTRVTVSRTHRDQLMALLSRL